MKCYALSKRFPLISQLYWMPTNLTDSVNSPSSDLSGWSKLLGQCVFNILNVHSALLTSQSLSGGEGKVWLYHHAVGNLYSGCHVPGVAHHGVNDPVLFNVAPDTIEEASRVSWMASVRQTQDAWITFINGDSPWDPVRPGTSVRDGEEAGRFMCSKTGVWVLSMTTCMTGLGLLLREGMQAFWQLHWGLNLPIEIHGCIHVNIAGLKMTPLGFP